MLTFLFLAMAVKTYFPTLTINTVPTYIFLGFSCGPSKNMDKNTKQGIKERKRKARKLKHKKKVHADAW